MVFIKRSINPLLETVFMREIVGLPTAIRVTIMIEYFNFGDDIVRREFQDRIMLKPWGWEEGSDIKITFDTRGEYDG